MHGLTDCDVFVIESSRCWVLDEISNLFQRTFNDGSTHPTETTEQGYLLNTSLSLKQTSEMANLEISFAIPPHLSLRMHICNKLIFELCFAHTNTSSLCQHQTVALPFCASGRCKTHTEPANSKKSQ